MTRQYIDEPAVWNLMRFAHEPAERVSSRQVSRPQEDPRGSIQSEKGAFHQELDLLVVDGDES